MKTVKEDEGIAILCDCCGSRVGWLRSGLLILKTKHHGEKHVTVLPVQELLSLAKAGEIRKIVRAMSL